VKYSANGDQSIKGSGVKDSGAWRVVGDKFCAKWNTIRKAERIMTAEKH